MWFYHHAAPKPQSRPKAHSYRIIWSPVSEHKDFELGNQEPNTCEFKAVCLLSIMFPLLHGYKHLGGLFLRQAMKLGSMILFATRKQDIFIYRLLAECSGSSDKCFTSWVTVRTGLVTTEEVSQGFISSRSFTWCILISPVSSSSLKMCTSEALALSSPPRHHALEDEGQSGSTHRGSDVCRRVGKRNGGLPAVHQHMFCGPRRALPASRSLGAILGDNGQTKSLSWATQHSPFFTCSRREAWATGSVSEPVNFYPWCFHSLPRVSLQISGRIKSLPIPQAFRFQVSLTVKSLKILCLKDLT